MFGKKNSMVSVGEKRRSRRFTANAPATVQTTASQTRAVIVNFSESGARLVVFDRIPLKREVRIIVNGIYLFGWITWKRDKAFGVRFDERSNIYSVEEIHRAIEAANEPLYEFDRDAILSGLANP